MNILLINIPSRKGKGGFMLPLGLLYVGGIIERCGHRAKIVDPYLDEFELKNFDSGNYNKINKIIEEFNPSLIGYSGIATSYGRTKKLSQHIKDNYPEIFQIAGRALSSVYHFLLTNTKIDLVFHGETEVSLPIFLKKFEKKKLFYDVPGISYLLNGKVVRNPSTIQVNHLDTIPFPAYHLVDINKYLHSIDDWISAYKILLNNNHHYSEIVRKIGNKKHYIPIITSRGCTHRCLFCYRHFQGIRQHSVNYVIAHIKYLMETYGIKGFQFVDELFNVKPEWVIEICDAIVKENLDIFYLIGGARVDKINEKILNRLKETGCIQIAYGQESGSDAILKECKKGVTSRQNNEITLLTTKTVGILSPVQLVVGFPGETNNTIRETIQFLKDVEAYQYSLNFLIALPETPIWKFVEENGLIKNVEEYLDLVAEKGGAPLVNLTRMSDRVWRNWHLIIRNELKLHYFRNKKLYYFYWPLYKIANRILPFVPHLFIKIISSIRRIWIAASI